MHHLFIGTNGYFRVNLNEIITSGTFVTQAPTLILMYLLYSCFHSFCIHILLM